jgi:peptidyl-prolyl cis-trans isomerase C
VFAVQGDQVLTQDDMDAAFAQIPEAHRMAFIRDGERVNQLVINLLRARQIAAVARAEDFDRDPLVAGQLKLEEEKDLAKLWMDHVMANAPDADYEALAEEYYLANPEAFMSPEILDVSHILVSTENRSEENALVIVEDLESRLAEDPLQFDSLVMEFSEDPAKTTNQGRYPQMKRGDMVKNFEQAAFDLQEPGQISDPVRTSYGFHIIRLNARTPAEPLPYDMVKEQLVEQQRQAYLAEYRKRYIIDQTDETIDVREDAVEAMLKRYFGEDLENAPVFEER